MNAHPKDYELHYFGTFDDEKGTFQVESAELLARAADVVEKKA